MPACATQKIITDQPTICNLFLQVPDTDFRDFLDEVEELGGNIRNGTCAASTLVRIIHERSVETLS